jgi:5-methylcytosine-specific restriction endonuclease McrA
MTTRVSNEEIIAAYLDTGSVWKAAKQVGIVGQTVHERLRAIGYKLAAQHWTDDETAELREQVTAGVPLGEIAQRLARSYAGVACKASELGVRSTARRPRKLPRGGGWDKANTTRHMKALTAHDGKVTQYARSNGLAVELLVRALQRHCPDQWRDYLASHSEIPQKTCPYCGDEFIPSSNGRQTYCTRKCGDDARADRSYFGGKRRSTVGLASQTCQLCRRQGVKGLSSHHVFGKEHDPENDFLIALCAGCHKCVTLLGSRAFADTEEGWEALISLVWMRREGARFAAGEFAEHEILHVTVDIDEYADPDDEMFAS